MQGRPRSLSGGFLIYVPPRLWDSISTLLPSSPVTIKQALKEEHERGYFGLLGRLVRDWYWLRKMRLPLSPPQRLCFQLKREEVNCGLSKKREFSRRDAETLRDNKGKIYEMELKLILLFEMNIIL